MKVDEIEIDSGGVMVLPGGTSFPESPTNGQVFYRTDENKLYRYDGTDTTWYHVPDAGCPCGGVDSSAIHTNTSSEISGISEKTVPVGDDLVVIEDSEASNAKKKVKISNIPSLPILVSSGSASVADNTKTTLATFTITDGKVPMPFVSLEEDTSSTQIYNDSTDAAPSSDEIYFCLEKTGTADQYLLTVRTNNVGGSAENRDIRWAVLEV